MRYKHLYYPESKFGGFTRFDGTIAFYTRVNALLGPAYTVLDYGCGRAEYQDDPVPFRRNLRIFSNKVDRVLGVDPDKHAAENPFIDEFRLLKEKQWPFDDNEIDICVCDWVIEHIKDPSNFFSEACRVLKENGYLCVRTMNLWSYQGFLTQVIPNSLHAAILSRAQHERKDEDIFPTYYKCNTPRKMRRYLTNYNFEHVIYTHEPEPAYLSFSKAAYFLGVLYQRLAPSAFYSNILVFARNRKTIN